MQTGETASFLMTFISDNSQWAGLIFALLAFGESTAFVGTVIPATPLLLLFGGLLAAGDLDPSGIVLAGIIGATLGYALSFAMGRLIGRSLMSRGWLRGQRRSVARARIFFRRYGAASLVFGRFVLGPFQSLLPFVAGAAGMSVRRFWIVNLISSILWVPICLAPGYLAVKGSGHLGIPPEWQSAMANSVYVLSFGAVLAILVGIAGERLLLLVRRLQA